MKNIVVSVKFVVIFIAILLIQCKPITLSRTSHKKVSKKDLTQLQKEIGELEKKLGIQKVIIEKKEKEVVPDNKKPEEIMEELEKEMLEKEQVQKFLSEKYYEIARVFYENRELENAKKSLLKSLEYDFSNEKAKALLEDIKLELGEATSGDVGTIAREETQRVLAQIQASRFEITKLYQEAIDNFREKKFQDAKVRFKRVIETLKWFPYELKMQDIEKKSQEYLKQIEKEMKRESFFKAKELREKAQQEARNIEEKEKVYTQKQLGQLLKEAVFHLKSKNFIKAKELVKQAQEVAPYNKKVEQLAAKIEEAEYIHKYKQLASIEEEEEAKRKIMEEDKTVIPSEEFNFPAKEIWAQIQKRKPDVPVIQAKEITIYQREVENNLRKLIVDSFQIGSLYDVLINIKTFAKDQGIKINFNYVGKAKPEEIQILQEKFSEGYLFPGGTGEDFIAELKKIFDKVLIKLVPGGVLFLEKTDEVIKEEFVTKLYNVRDIITPMNTLDIAPRIATGERTIEEFRVKPMTDDPSLPSVEEALNKSVTSLVSVICNEIRDYLKTTEDSPPCDDAEKLKKFINADNAPNLGVISITAPEEAHLVVKEILKNVRQYSSMLVSVETRFLLVTEDFIQDIGLDTRGLNADDFDRAIVMSSFPNPPFNFFSRDIAKEVSVPPGQLPVPPIIKNEPSAGFFRESHDLRGRLENLMADDQVVRTLFRNIIEPAGGLTLQYTLLGNTQINAILRAVERDRRVKTLLGQNVVAHNGERVYFRNVNKLKYVKKVTETGSGPGGQPILNIEPADIVDGVFLDVRPIIDNDRKYVRLELEPQVVQLIPPPPDMKKIEFIAGTTTTAIGQPNTSQTTGEIKRFIETPEREFQELKTSVVVPDGGTVLIGGLTGRVEGTARQEVPVLSKIPIIGSLFTRKIKGYQRRILIILVTAKIIVPEEKE